MASNTFNKNIDQEVFINCIECRPVVWDKTLEIYKDKIAKAAAWREICVILNEDFEAMEHKERQEFVRSHIVTQGAVYRERCTDVTEPRGVYLIRYTGQLTCFIPACLRFEKYVIKKWNTTRDAWIRTLSEKKKLKKSGASASNTKPYKYHNQMVFLEKVVTPGETHENVPGNVNETNKSDNISETEEINKENEEEPGQIMEQSSSDRQKKRENLAQKANKRNLNEVDTKMIEYMNDQLEKSKNEPEDPNLSLFKGILPQLSSLNEHQILEFQSGVINLLQNIKSRRYGQSNYEWSPYLQNSSILIPHLSVSEGKQTYESPESGHRLRGRSQTQKIHQRVVGLFDWNRIPDGRRIDEEEVMRGKRKWVTGTLTH
ncbi:hypothetical protein EVAR_98814_1 [Eumeta japonica]|uniref:BESS domain-containing protein n=1 Tax=Eumeta variegata TaxID=151549 RepID=A0A4C2A9U2_EUMVA|nr:hypothetical protein EVAR_98814_1 [Eumeta japonica]